MRTKIIYLLTAATVLVMSVVFLQLEQQTKTPRYHQHLEQPKEADLGPCKVCGGKAKLCTHLPIIRINTGGQKIPGEAILDEFDSVLDYKTGDNGELRIPVELSTVENENDWNHAEDPALHSATALFRYRGNSSRMFAKHNFFIKLVEDDDHLRSRELPLMGMPSGGEWALHGPFLDKTLIRNYMWMNISAEVMGYAPAVRFCELILNGEYQGLYVLMETIDEGSSRINLTNYEPGDPVCSYILRIGSHLNELKTINTFSLYTYRLEEEREIEVLYPRTQYQTQQVHDYIRSDLGEIERLLYSVHMNDRSRLYKNYIDVDSFVNYYILQEFLGVNDVFSNSTYFYRDVRGKLHIGPVWDYNNVLDNFFTPVDMESFILSQRGWYGQLMQDEEFVEQVIARYRELRRDKLSDERLSAYIDETILWLGSAVDRNYEVWGYTFDPADSRMSRLEYRQPALHETEAIRQEHPENASDIIARRIRELNPENFDAAIEQMRSTMFARSAWMDEHIESLRQHCADSRNATKILD